MVRSNKTIEPPDSSDFATESFVWKPVMGPTRRSILKEDIIKVQKKIYKNKLPEKLFHVMSLN
jgi:hypothetical protein